jgi:hypothetical protein
MSERIAEWDSREALLLGAKTSNVCWAFRDCLRESILILENPQKHTEHGAAVGRLFDAATALELELRSDIGIHGLSDVPPEARLRTASVPSYVAGEAT